MRVRARPPSDGDKFPHLYTSMFAASFVSMFSEKLSTLFLATFKKKPPSRSA